MSKIGFRPRLDMVLARPLTTISEEEYVIGDVRNPIIVEKGDVIPVDDWAVIVEGNKSIPDLKADDQVFFKGKVEQVSFNGDVYYLIRNDSCLGVADEIDTP